MLLTWALIAAIFASIDAASLNFSDFNERILGGSEAAEGQFPYMVSFSDELYGHFCGGSIISPKTILTAAHCTGGRPMDRLFVLTETTKLNSGGVKHKIVKMINHEKWNEDTIENDVAVLILENPIKFSNKAQPIPLEENFIDGGVVGTVTGWGKTKDGDWEPPSVSLKMLNSTTITLKDCRKMVGGKPKVFDSQLCTLNDKGEGTCHMDSGSPIVANGKQIGIDSWGPGCGIGKPDVYTRVGFYREWIDKNSV